MVNGLADFFEISGEDAGFLEDLNARCVMNVYSPDGKLSGIRYTGENLSIHDMENVIGIVRTSKDLFLMPIYGDLFFHPAFAVLGFAPELGKTVYALRVDMEQLPEAYDFESLRPYFENEDNLRKAGLAGAEFSRDEEDYSY